MHVTHLPQALLILLTLTLTQTTLARPEPRSDQVPLDSNLQQVALDPRSPEARQQRLEAWLAQKPMHTTALLAGAAATAIPKSQLRDGRRRDLSSITGEKGIWIPIQFWDEGEEKRDHKSEDVRGEKLLELEVEVDDVDEDVEVERPVHGPRCVMEKVWKKLEKIGLVVQGKRQHVEKVKDLDNGNDGDL